MDQFLDDCRKMEYVDQVTMLKTVAAKAAAKGDMNASVAALSQLAGHDQELVRQNQERLKVQQEQLKAATAMINNPEVRARSRVLTQTSENSHSQIIEPSCTGWAACA